MKILWVDDDEMLTDLGLALLKRLGVEEVDAVNSAEEAWKLISRKKYNLLITDLEMPGMSGYQLIEMIHQKFNELKIAAASGWGEAMSVKTDFFLKKPFSSDDLKNLLTTAAAHC